MTRLSARRATRIVILCEGETETIAIKQFIRRQWEKDGLRSVALHPIDLRGKIEDVHVKVPLFLREPKVIAVFTLIDLYEMKRVEHRKCDTVAEKVELCRDWLRDGFRADEARRFHPHLSVHEVEAWILAEGKALSARLRDPSITPDSRAEERNDQNPPTSRLSALFRKCGHRGGYQKIKDGTPLFRRQEFTAVYESCMYFRGFYEDLKQVAQHALGDPSGQKPFA